MAARYCRKWLWAEIGNVEYGGGCRKWLWAEIGNGGEGEIKRGLRAPFVILCVMEISWRIRFSGWLEGGRSLLPVVIGLHCFRFRH